MVVNGARSFLRLKAHRGQLKMFQQRTEPTVEPMLLTARQAAKVLSISERTLFSVTKSGELPAVRIGRSVRYSVDALREYIRRSSEEKCEDSQNRA